MPNKLMFAATNCCFIVSHNRNEIELIWSGSTGDANTIHGLIMDNSETTIQINNMHRKLDVIGSLNTERIINNSPLIKKMESSSCSGEPWKGK